MVQKVLMVLMVLRLLMDQKVHLLDRLGPMDQKVLMVLQQKLLMALRLQMDLMALRLQMDLMDPQEVLGVQKARRGQKTLLNAHL
jgi:hypothetical protein